MSGELNILFVLCCSAAAYAADNFPPPTDIHISHLDLGKVNVSWKHSAHLGENTKYLVRVPDLEDDITEITSNSFTLLDWLAVHRGLNIKVAVVEIINGQIVTDPIEWASEDLPPLPGDEGTAPLKLTCTAPIDENEKYWLNCDWLPGEKAPPDTQYFLYFRHADATKKCLNYVTEPGGGRRIGCRTLFSDTLIADTKFLIHINGSSHSRQIRTMEYVFNLHDVEVIPPVQNLVLKQNKSLSWTKPIRSFPDDCFNYQINIWSEDKNETITVSKVQQFWNEDLKEATNKLHVRVRAVGKSPCWKMEKHSSWTQVLYIEGNNNEKLWLTLTACLSVACLAIFLLCVRFWRSVFPQIPKPKDDLKDAFKFAQHQALIRCNSWDTEEVISNIEVVGCPDKPPDYAEVTE